MAEKKLTIEKSMSDFKLAYQAKRKLIEREQEDFRFALGDQWSKEDLATLREAGIKPITDNRIAPNLFLLTGLERQNRTDFKAFPEGEEDSVKAEIASALFKNAIKVSDFPYKSSDQFKDGITCGESHLELYLDNTDNLLNGKPSWRKLDGNTLFPEPGFAEYDFRDCRYVYKIIRDISKGDLINLYPKSKRAIEKVGQGKIDISAMLDEGGDHVQRRDYPKNGESSDTGTVNDKDQEGQFDLIERYYKKWVETFFIGDMETGNIQEAEDEEKAQAFIDDYRNQIASDQQAYDGAVQQTMGAAMADPEISQIPPEELQISLEQSGMLPPQPPPRNPDRFILIKRQIPEIWCFAHVPGVEKPLGDDRAWFYPKWKMYPFVPFFARFSTAPLTGDDRHLLVQGLVHGVKGVQEKHNKTEMLMLRHLNSTANSGWLTEEDAWVDKSQVKSFGSMPGINLEYKKGFQKPERIIPTPLSQGHHEISLESAEAIKAQLGINADLLATQEGSSQSGRAIALRQKQGLLMVQEPFDNLSRSRIIAGRFLLSQLGEIFDTETAKKVLGDAFLVKYFPPPMEVVEGPGGLPQVDPATGMPAQQPMVDPKTGQPMQYDAELAEVAIAEVLAGDLGTYDVAVGEAVASETQKLANSQEVQEISQQYPGMIPPDVLIEESQLPQSTKKRIIASIQQAQQAMMAGGGQPPPKKKSADSAAA